MDFWNNLPQWAKEAIWTAFIAAIVGILFSEARHLIVTLIEHFQTKVDIKVLDHLSRTDPGENTTVKTLVKTLSIRKGRIEASLHRLEQKQLAETNDNGYWHKIVRYKAR